MQIHDYKLTPISFNDVLTEAPLFSCLSVNDAVKIRTDSVNRSFDKGSIIQTKGKNVKYMFFVLSGYVKETFDDF